MAEIFGIEVGELADSRIPVEAIVITKSMFTDKNDEMVLDISCSSGLMLWDVIGMLRAYAAEAEARFVDL